MYIAFNFTFLGHGTSQHLVLLLSAITIMFWRTYNWKSEIRWVLWHCWPPGEAVSLAYQLNGRGISHFPTSSNYTNLKRLLWGWWQGVKIVTNPIYKTQEHSGGKQQPYQKIWLITFLSSFNLASNFWQLTGWDALPEQEAQVISAELLQWFSGDWWDCQRIIWGHLVRPTDGDETRIQVCITVSYYTCRHTSPQN